MPPGFPARAGFGFLFVTAANGAVTLSLRSGDRTWAGLACACLGAVDVPAVRSELDEFGGLGELESGGAAGAAEPTAPAMAEGAGGE